MAGDRGFGNKEIHYTPALAGGARGDHKEHGENHLKISVVSVLSMVNAF